MPIIENPFRPSQTKIDLETKRQRERRYAIDMDLPFGADTLTQQLIRVGARTERGKERYQREITSIHEDTLRDYCGAKIAVCIQLDKFIRHRLVPEYKQENLLHTNLEQYILTTDTILTALSDAFFFPYQIGRSDEIHMISQAFSKRSDYLLQKRSLQQQNILQARQIMQLFNVPFKADGTLHIDSDSADEIQHESGVGIGYLLKPLQSSFTDLDKIEYTCGVRIGLYHCKVYPANSIRTIWQYNDISLLQPDSYNYALSFVPESVQKKYPEGLL